MINSKYVRDLLSEHNISLSDFAEEWSRVSGKGKYQPGVSAVLKRGDIDRMSFVIALSNLTKIPLTDIFASNSFKTNEKVEYRNAELTNNEILPVASIAEAEYVKKSNHSDFIAVPNNFMKGKVGYKSAFIINNNKMAPLIKKGDVGVFRLLDGIEHKKMIANKIYCLIVFGNVMVRKVYPQNDYLIAIDSDEKNNIKYDNIDQSWELLFVINFDIYDEVDKNQITNEKLMEVDSRFNLLNNRLTDLMNQIQTLRNEVAQKT